MARKEKKYHFIYKTTNMLSGRYYIGMHSTNDLYDAYLGSGNRLKLAIRKHGKKNFVREILYFCDSREDLSKRESEIINLDEIAKEECMNLVVGGEGGTATAEASSKWLKKQWKKTDFRKKRSQESGERMKQHHKDGKISYDTFTGKKHSSETRRKMSESKKGKYVGKCNSQFGTCWITNEKENKKIKKEDLHLYLQQGWRQGRSF